MNLKDLHRPFDPRVIEWRAGRVAGRRVTLLAYLTSRHVMGRLDEVCGSENWADDYLAGPGGGVMCRLSIRIGDEWVTKCDGADNSNIEAIKGGYSGAFKRAAVKWGIGRYLYGLDTDWHDLRDGWANGRGIDISADRRHAGWVPFPALPAWAVPK